MEEVEKVKTIAWQAFNQKYKKRNLDYRLTSVHKGLWTWKVEFSPVPKSGEGIRGGQVHVKISKKDLRVLSILGFK